MPVRFNHTILPAKDAAATAAFVAAILGVEPARRAWHFHVVDLADDASIDYVDVPADYTAFGTHVAFLVSDAEFDQIFARIRERSVQFWADPRMGRPNEINTLHGGRGVYFDDLAGNHLEVITGPYEK